MPFQALLSDDTGRIYAFRGEGRRGARVSRDSGSAGGCVAGAVGRRTVVLCGAMERGAGCAAGPWWWAAVAAVPWGCAVGQGC